MIFDQLKRREFITLLGGTAAAWPLAARAQQPAMPVVGLLNAGSREGSLHFIAHHGLKETGFVEGQNMALEYRWAEGRNDRLAALAADHVRRQVAAIVASSGSVLPAMAATTTIPIVLLTPGDPVVQRFVPSLNRPGRNVTGVSFFNATLGAKRLELLREMVPKATTLAFLVSNATAEDALRDTQAATQALGLRLQN
jgi:putative ABC transport system substrate-binding protein